MQITVTIPSADNVFPAGLCAVLVLFLCLTVGTVSPSAAQVTPGTIGFDHVSNGGESNLTINGIYFGDANTGSPFFGWKAETNFGNPPPEVDAHSIDVDPSNTQARFVSDDGSNFQLDALDFDNFSGQSIDVVITGYRDGSPVSGATKVKTLNNGAGGTWVTVSLGSDFERIDEVRVSTNGYAGQNPSGLAMDNVVVDDAAAANAAPTFTDGAGTSQTVDEDAAAASLSSQLETDDPDAGQTLEWTVSSAPSNGTLSGFPATESSGTGVKPSGLTYEPNSDFSGSDAFDVQVSDGTDTDVITVNVTVDNLAPVFNSSNTTSVPENSTGTVLDVNADNGGDGANDSGLNYTLSGGADPGVFSIDATTGELSLDAALDYENPSDSDTNNDYVIDVTADDGESSNNTTTQTITVSVTDVNESPAVTTNSGLTLDEGATKTIDSGALSANDVDAGDGASSLTYTITSGPSNGALLVNGSSATSFTEQNLVDGVVAYQHDGSETTSDSFTFDLTDDEGAGPTGETFSISIMELNDTPTISSISDQTIEENGTLSSLSFTVGDQETSASNLTVTASSDNQDLVPSGPGTSKITFTGPDANGNTSITVEPLSNESGTTTITVVVDDHAPNNNTAEEQFTLTVEAVADLTITDGSASELDFTPDVSPGTNNNPVGIFELSAGQSGATLDEVTVTNNSPGVSGITNARLYLSADQNLVPGEDQQEASFDVTDNNAEAEFDFTGIGSMIPTGGYYAILAIDVASGASASGIQFSLDQASDLTVSGGEIATVNGNNTSTFSALPLSNGTTALPVELSSFDATTNERDAVTLQWQTALEINNAGFEVQRKIGSVVKPSRRDGSTPSVGGRVENWQTVGSVDGAGTTTEAQSYRFADTDVPYDADSLTYRLKQVDTDGSTSYSEPITVARSTVQQVQFLGTYPNPARSRATVRFALPEGATDDAVTLRLYDALGRQMRTVQASAEAGRHTLQLETDGLSSGVYFLRLQAGTTVKTQRLTVVR